MCIQSTYWCFGGILPGCFYLHLYFVSLCELDCSEGGETRVGAVSPVIKLPAAISVSNFPGIFFFCVQGTGLKAFVFLHCKSPALC